MLQDNTSYSEVTERSRKPQLYKPGQSGNPNGRPKGARSKLNELFWNDLHKDWESHGIQAIQKVREERPQDYLKVVAMLMPKEMTIRTDPLEDLDDDQLRSRLRLFADFITDACGSAPGSVEDSGDAATQAETEPASQLQALSETT